MSETENFFRKPEGCRALSSFSAKLSLYSGGGSCDLVSSMELLFSLLSGG